MKGPWRWARAERRCRALEDELWAELAAEAIDVTTPLGSTRAYRWPGEGAPVVLLHGGACTSVVWQPLVEALADRDVYAVDILGDVGRSEPSAPLADMADLAEWFDATLDALGLDRVQLVGHSLGGTVAIHVARRHPERLTSLVLFDPGAVVPIEMGPFMRWGLPVMLGSFLPAAARRAVARRKRHPLGADKRHGRLMLLGVLFHRPGFPIEQTTFTDEELATIAVPTTLVVGAETEMFDTHAMVDRMAALLPSVTTASVPGAGHALTVSHVDACADRIAMATRGRSRASAGGGATTPSSASTRWSACCGTTTATRRRRRSTCRRGPAPRACTAGAATVTRSSSCTAWVAPV
jgi:pimeloyl-ACP methyl ester carboxylesterase